MTRQNRSSRPEISRNKIDINKKLRYFDISTVNIIYITLFICIFSTEIKKGGRCQSDCILITL